MAVTTTTQVDCIANMTTRERSYSGGPTDEGHLHVFVKFTLPDLSGEVISSATIQLEKRVESISNDTIFDVYADDVDPWDETSSVSVLEALSFSAATEEDVTASPAIKDTFNFDVLEGILRAYAGGDSEITVRLKWTNFTEGAPVPDRAAANLILGDSIDRTRSVEFFHRGEPEFPRLVLTHTTGALPVTGTAAATIPMQVAAVRGGEPITGTAAATIPMQVAAAVGGLKSSGTAAATIPMQVAAATGIVGARGVVAATIPMQVATVAGIRTSKGVVAATIPMQVAAVLGKAPPIPGFVAATIPMQIATATGGERIGAGFLILERFGSDALRGVENITLMDTFGNAIGGSDFSEAQSAAGASHYLEYIIWNQHPTETAESVVAWIDPASDATLRIASEALVNGATQSIANEATSPTGRTWVNPTTHGTALSLGNIAPGAGIALWREITIGAGAAASPKELVALRYAFTLDSTRYEQTMRGLFRIAATQATPWAMYAKLGSVPVPGVDSPLDTSADGVFSKVSVLTEGRWYFVFTETDIYGLESIVSDTEFVDIDSGENLVNPKPIGPDNQSITPDTDGTTIVTASYLPIQEPDIDDRATHWLIYSTTDGVDPVPGTDTPEVVAMVRSTGLQREQLTHTLAAAIEGSPVAAIVQTRRIESGPVNFDSINTDIVSTTAINRGPARMRGEASYGRAHGTFYERHHADTETIDVSVPNNVFFEVSDGNIELWMGAILVWRRISDGEEQTLYIPSEFEIETSPIGGSGTNEAVEAASASFVYLNANGTRVVEIDTAGMTIRASAWSFGDVDSVGITKDTPSWEQFAASLFSAFDVDEQNNTVYLNVEAGRAHVSASIDHTLNQAAIEAL